MTTADTNPPQGGRLERAADGWRRFTGVFSQFGQGVVPTNEGKYSYVITKREHVERIIFALLAWCITLALCVSVARWALNEMAGLYLGTAAWLYGVALTLEHFVVIVPELTALMTVNVLKQRAAEDEFASYLVFPTGLYFKFPWEVAKIGNYINTRFYSFNIKENIAARQGPMLDLKILAFWRPNIHLLPRNIAFEGEDVQQDLAGYITGYYTQLIVERDVHEARAEIHNLDKNVRNRVLIASEERLSHESVAELALRQGYRPTLEFLTGSEFSSIRIVDADYEEKFQESLTNNATAALVMAHARELMRDQPDENGDPIPGSGLSLKEAENAALIVFKLVEKKIEEKELNINEGLAGLIAATFRDVAREFFQAKYGAA